MGFVLDLSMDKPLEYLESSIEYEFNDDEYADNLIDMYYFTVNGFEYICHIQGEIH